MASTNKTSNLELSQFIATDTPTWLVDYNGDMEKIDAGVGRVKELAETASTQAVGVESGLQATNQAVTTLSGQVANVQNQANITTASVNGINNKLGNADISDIGDGTITGAISMQNSNLSWKPLKLNATYRQKYQLPLNAKEIYVEVLMNNGYAYTQNIIFNSAKMSSYITGWGNSTNPNYFQTDVNTNGELEIHGIFYNGDDVSAGSIINIYYQ